MMRNCKSFQNRFPNLIILSCISMLHNIQCDANKTTMVRCSDSGIQSSSRNSSCANKSASQNSFCCASQYSNRNFSTTLRTLVLKHNSHATKETTSTPDSARCLWQIDPLFGHVRGIVICMSPTSCVCSS